MKAYLVPLAILLSGILIAGAVVYSGTTGTSIIKVESDAKDLPNHVTPEAGSELIAPGRSENALVYGNPDAPYAVVEFSDFECPFCARVHPTLKQLVDESNGDIKWEYRHLPLSIHKNAIPAATASECVASLKGVEAFWQFAEHLFANQRTLDIPVYVEGASKLGIAEDALMECMNDPAIHDRVKADEQIAVALGGGGTPFNVIVFPDGKTRAVPGALSLEQFKSLIAN